GSPRQASTARSGCSLRLVWASSASSPSRLSSVISASNKGIFMSITEKYSGVELQTAANVYFDGKCVSHNFVTADGNHKSVGVVLPAKLTFGTSKPEIMECVGGGCRYLLKGENEWKSCSAG